jgi:biopolymer transport protein ExbD
MIDVVFLLLIYFMVATEFRRAEASFPMDLPKQARNASQVLDDSPLVILVETTSIGSDQFRLQLEGPWGRVSGLHELKVFLKTNRADGFGSGGLFTEDHPITITPSKSTQWDHALDVYNAVVQARYTNITLGAPQ